MTSRDIVVLAGYFGRCPLGGYGWQILHYLLGLQELGFDAYFYEDTAYFGDCFDPVSGMMYSTPERGIEALEKAFTRFGLQDRWIFRDAQRDCIHGLTKERAHDVLSNARLIITLAPVTRLARRKNERKIFIDIDPGYTQLRLHQGDASLREFLAEHDVHFTIGENIGTARCPIPGGGFDWLPTRQPVVTHLWEAPPANPAAPFTTLGRWDEARRDTTFEGEIYGWNKRQQWMPFLRLPQDTGARFVLAMDIDKNPADRELLQAHGWNITDPLAVSRDLEKYRRFIQNSQGEFTVAKDLNIRLKTGWFSDRSVCYLAAGRPVVNQATGFEDLLPTGEGLFAFRTPDEAARAIQEIRFNPELHGRAARRIAIEHFEATAVLGSLLSRC